MKGSLYIDLSTHTGGSNNFDPRNLINTCNPNEFVDVVGASNFRGNTSRSSLGGIDVVVVGIFETDGGGRCAR